MKNFFLFLSFSVFIVIIRIFFIDIVNITSYSMVPSLWPGEWVVVVKDTNIKRGDIITFYSEDSSDIYIKRAIGINEDKVSYIDDVITLNNQKQIQQKDQLTRELPNDLKERSFKAFVESIDEKKYSILIDQDKANQNIENIKVQNHYFVLGDNRNHSKDSRVFGLIPRKKIIGKAVRVIYSNGEIFKAL